MLSPSSRNSALTPAPVVHQRLRACAPWPQSTRGAAWLRWVRMLSWCWSAPRAELPTRPPGSRRRSEVGEYVQPRLRDDGDDDVARNRDGRNPAERRTEVVPGRSSEA